MEIITIKSGDTVLSIANQYNLSPEKIISDNGLDDEGSLVVGQSLILLFPNEQYTVTNPNQTVERLAFELGTSSKQLFQNNYFLGGNNNLEEGMTLVKSYIDPPSVQKIIGGYAYEFISDELLRSTVSYLTYLIPFTYGFTPRGELIFPKVLPLVETAQAYNVKPLMHLSTLTEQGVFSNELSHLLLTNRDAIITLYDNILLTISENGYYGVDVDFEFLLAEDKEAYISFIMGLTELMNENGYICVVAVPPKTSDDQRGLLYEGIDYEALGNSANYVFVMTYEWGYRFGPPLAVAPIDSVRRVIDYAISRIPKEKLLLGISNYGYDWTLPFIRGQSEAISISTVEALQTALYYNAEILFDQQSKAPYFYYTDTLQREHVVWYEDARSFNEKVLLIKEYDLAGGFIWDLMRENPQGFVTINAGIDIL